MSVFGSFWAHASLGINFASRAQYLSILFELIPMDAEVLLLDGAIVTGTVTLY